MVLKNRISKGNSYGMLLLIANDRVCGFIGFCTFQMVIELMTRALLWNIRRISLPRMLDVMCNRLQGKPVVLFFLLVAINCLFNSVCSQFALLSWCNTPWRLVDLPEFIFVVALICYVKAVVRKLVEWVFNWRFVILQREFFGTSRLTFMRMGLVSPKQII